MVLSLVPSGSSAAWVFGFSYLSYLWLRLRTGTFCPRAPLSRCHQCPCCHCLCLRGCWHLAQLVSTAPQGTGRAAPPLHPGSPGLQALAIRGKGCRWLGSQSWEGPHIVRGCWVHGHCCCGWKLPGVVSPQLAGWGPRPHCLCHWVACSRGDCWGSEAGVLFWLPWRYCVFWERRLSCCSWRLGIISPTLPLLLVLPFLYVPVQTLICTDEWNSLASWGVGQRQLCWVMDVLLVLDRRGATKSHSAMMLTSPWACISCWGDYQEELWKFQAISFSWLL